MSKNILEANALSFMNSIKVIERLMKEVWELINVDKPSVLFNNIDDIEKIVRQIEFNVIIMDQVSKALVNDFRTSVSELKERRRILLEKIAERKATGVQMNTNGNFFSEDNLLSEIALELSNESPTWRNIKVDHIIHPHEYSTLSIVNNLDLLGDVLEELDDIVVNGFETMIHLDRIKSYLLEIKSKLSDTEFISTMTSDIWTDDCVAERNWLVNRLDVVTTVIDTDNMIKTLFRTFVALYNNFNIYENAVDSYVSLALECFFNKDTYYEFC